MKTEKGSRKMTKQPTQRSDSSSKIKKAERISSAHAHDPGIRQEHGNFTRMLETINPNDHLCLIYESKEEWRAAAVPFISSGLKRGEKCIYIVDTSTADEIRRYLSEEGIDLPSTEKSGQLSILNHTEAYTREGSFDPDRMIALLIEETDKAVSEGYPALRATGEMTWVLHGHPGSEKLLEYEAKLNKDFFPIYPCLAICQYDRWKFDPEIIKGVVMTHPLLVKNNRIYRNFYYIPPEEFLDQKRAEKEVQHWLNNIEREQRMWEELRESEGRLKNIIEHSTNLFYTHDMNHVIKYVSPQSKDILGYGEEEVLQRWTDFISDHPINEIGFQNTVKAIETGQPQPPYELELVHKKGKKVWVEVREAPVVKDGKTVSIVGSLTDITERKKMEQEVKASEEKYRTLVESSTDALLMLDMDRRIISCNQGFYNLFGYSREEVEGKSVRIIHASDESFRHFGEFAYPIVMREGFFRGEMNQVRKNGSEIPVEIVLSAIKSSDGSITGYVSIMRDITERKQIEEALRKSEERFRDLFNDAPVGYHELDIEGRIINVNRRELEMLGYTYEEMVGRYIWKFVTEEEKVHKSVLDKLSGVIPPAKGFERVLHRKDGTTLPVLIEDELIRDSEGKIIGMKSTQQDITERKRAEQEKAALEEQLRQSQKMEAIGLLAGGIAHDFNNILTVIKGVCQLSLLDLREGDPLYANLKEIERSTERAADLTRQLLAFSRKQVLEPQVLDLNGIIKHLEKMLHRILGEDIELVTFFTEELGRVKVDPGQMEQAIINLLVNARDAMPRGGKLTFETSNVELDEEYARRHIGVKPGSYVMLSISDTGVGMTQEVKERLFEPFFTTKEMGKGTGLGLSTVYGIVKQSGGNIWVYSELGQGTTFKIYLPRVDEPLEKRKEEVIKEIPQGSETILVVEDEESLRKLAVRLLKRQGYNVLEAPDGGQAFILCEKYHEPIHLILSDVVMPGMSGREFVKRLQKIHPEARALYMSGYTDNVILHHGILEKGIEFIQKPFTLESLSRKVREVLDK